ncbi:hypothetical protein [Methylobrevis pamukkalensis]|uniref:Uncharacterized protein n=1 Tax=Methylobrevis pamukkalensis TaxID=1439726 RepID=A0A1E3H7C9_9HYPH|nr:hypothetical protein [Methylobrevis pamukkalensis]ODN72239.1 hypothetical protein A6302_00428 [Methylobrevis pamukkalensis]
MQFSPLPFVRDVSRLVKQSVDLGVFALRNFTDLRRSLAEIKGRSGLLCEEFSATMADLDRSGREMTRITAETRTRIAGIDDMTRASLDALKAEIEATAGTARDVLKSIMAIAQETRILSLTPGSRRRGPARPGGALRSSPTRSAGLPTGR